MRNLSGIYKITCIANDKFYIGKSINIDNRWKAHKRKLHCKDHDNIHLQRCFDKYGINSLRFEILCICEDPYMTELEQKLIDLYVNEELCVNINQSSTSPPSRLGHKHSDETKTKMILSRSGDKNHHFGKKLKPESIEKRTLKRQKNYSFLDPLGNVVKLVNLNKFCIENNLNNGHMYQVFKGKLKQYKGWRMTN